MQNTTHKLVITNPCSENWEAMSTNDRGRFCDACQKTVVDFTTQSDNQIKQFIASRPGEKLCGRFYKHQIDRIRIEIDPEIFQKTLPYWQKFLVILLVCFGSDLFGCDFVFGQWDTIPQVVQQIDSLPQPDTMISLTQDSIPEEKPAKTRGKKSKKIVMSIAMGDIIISGSISYNPEPWFEPKLLSLNGETCANETTTNEVDSTKLPGIRSASEEKPQPAKKEEKSEMPLLAVLNSEDRRKKMGGE